MLHSKKMKILLAVSSVVAASFVSLANPVSAQTVNGQQGLDINDASRHTKISMRYDSDTDEFVSYYKDQERGRVSASAWKDAQIDKNNAAISKEKQDAQTAAANQANARSEADKNLNARADALKSDSYVHYDDESQGSLTFTGTNGTTVKNVADGDVAENSTDAVNAGQVNKVKEKLAKETEARNNAIASEAKQRKEADDALSKRIGNASEISSNAYISSDNTVADNLLTLDDTIYNQGKDIDALRKDTDKKMSEEAKARDSADKALAERIGAIDADAKTDYIDANSSVADNLKKLDQATKDLENSYNSASDELEDLIDSTAEDREKADRELLDRIGTISSTENLTYISYDESVSDSLAALDKATKDNADAIEKEINDRTKAVADFGNDINNALTDLANENENVGAGAAALAGLSYLPYENNQRINVAAAVGHYGTKNAVALGTKYNINEDASLNLATTVGDGHNIVSYGVSLKVGPSSTYGRKVRKAQMDKAMKASREALAEAKAQNKWLSAEAAYYGDMNRSLPRRFRMAKLIDDRLCHGEKIDKELIIEYADELRYIRAHRNLR